MDLGALFHCLRPSLPSTTWRQWSRIALALLVMTGRVTMLGISRWAGQGGSYRTVQRFFSTVIPWAILFWVFFRQPVDCPAAVDLAAGDAGIGTKAGKCTHGLDRCFASLYDQPGPGLAFFTLSLVRVQKRRALPMRVEQGVRSDAAKAASTAKAAAKTPQALHAKRRPGRPPGSTHTNQAPRTLTPERVRLKAMVAALLRLLPTVLAVTSLGLAGPFGHPNALQRARQCTVHRMSTRRCDAALDFPSTGPYAGRGPRRKYGRRVADANLPERSLKPTTVDGHIETRLSQAQRLPKDGTPPWHVVIIVKPNRRTQARAHVVLFSSALALAYASLGDYDGLRFQMELNFRDAKQYWGLEDVMNVTPTGVTNAAHRSLFMGNVAYCLRTASHPRDADDRVLDLKAAGRGYKYVEETITMLPEKPEPVLLRQMLNKVASWGRLHASQPSFSFS